MHQSGEKEGVKKILLFFLAGWLNPVFLATKIKWLHERKEVNCFNIPQCIFYENKL